MAKTLIVVAQRAKARMIQHDGAGEPLVEVATLEHPASRAHDRDLTSDRPGRVHERTGEGRSAMAAEETHKEREASNFAREVAEDIRGRRNENAFQRLILVAEPGFLGMLRAALDDPTKQLIHSEVQKELTDLRLDDLGGHLEGLRIG